MNPQLFLSTTFILFLSIHSFACSFDDLTDNCKIFNNSDKQKFDLPDGTFIPNFSAIAKINSKITVAQRIDDDEKRRLEWSNTNALKCLKIKQEVRKAAPTIVDMPECAVLIAIFDKSDEKVKSTIHIAWPMEEPVGIKSMKIKDIRTEFMQRTGQEWTKIVQLADDYRSYNAPNSAIFKTSFESELDKDLNNLSPTRINHMDDLFKFAKENVIKTILAGREFSQLTAIEQNEVKKIQLIEFDNSPEKSQQGCSGSSPNAFYDPTVHKFYVCKNMYNLPDSAIVAVIGHEIGHSIDPCISQFALYKINPKTLEKLSDQEVKSDNEKFMLKEMIKNQAKDAKYTSYPFSLSFKEDSLKFFEQGGVLSKVTEGIKESENPFKDVVNCLNLNKGVRMQTPALVSSMAKEVSGFRAEHSDKSYSRAADEQKIANAFNAHPECLVVEDKHSQMGESFADWLGAEVLGEYLSKNPPGSSSLQKLAPFAFFAGQACAARENLASQAKEQLNDSDIIRAAMTDAVRVNDAHPNSKKRLDNTFLQNEKVRKALGCPDEGKPCLHQTGSAEHRYDGRVQ